MDQLTKINWAAIFPILILPAWAVFRLQNPKISIIIGGLIFWCWLVLLGEFTRGFDPSYDSFAPVFNFFLGLPFGLGYCAFWEAIRRFLRRNKKVSPNSIDLILWTFLIALCICFPFIFKSVYQRNPMDYFFEILFGIGPILLLCFAMVLKMALDVYHRKTGSDPIKNHEV
jgi:hypothetical protein